MTTPIQPTLQSPASPDLRGLLSALGLEVRKQVNCARIGNIQSFDAGNQTATVQIAQQQITSVSPEGVQTIAAFPLLVSVPVFILGGGGLSATFPIAQGDECLIVFSDREIDNWLLAGGTETTPTTSRVHDLSDGMCFVGFRSYPRSIDGYSTNSAQLRTDDGSTYVEVTQAGVVNAVSPNVINLNAPRVNISGVLDVQNIDASSTPCVINGNITTNGDVIASSISLVNHVHGGVTAGGSNTTGPV